MDFGFKTVTSIHDRLAFEVSWCQEEANIPECMISRKTTLIQKPTTKVTIPSNYRPITCLPLMWKTLTSQIREDISYSLVCSGLFQEEQERCYMGTRGTGDTVHWSAHRVREQSKAEICSHDMDWLQKKTRKYGPTNLDCWQSKNVHDIR